MSRKHFNETARLIHRSNERAAAMPERRESLAVQESNLDLARGLSAMFLAENPRFDHGRFMQACGFAAAAAVDSLPPH